MKPRSVTSNQPALRAPAPAMRGNRPRGVAAVVFVAAMLVVSTLVLWVFQETAGSARGALAQLYSTNAFYGAESGIEFALRELSLVSDLDGDGTVGSISDDGNDANDPVLSNVSFHVQQNLQVLTATGNKQSHRRVVEATLQ
ncbi:MAG: hypothetical protein V3T70_03490 [Phycisphaerae bacterium]